MFYETDNINDLAAMLMEVLPHLPVIIKAYHTLNSIITRDNPTAVLFYDDDNTWTVYDFDPAQPACVEHINDFFEGCKILGVTVKTSYDGEPANIITVYAKAWG